MNINRNNYEEYFLLYVDNELTAGERNTVEEFINQNPDLREELIRMQETLLEPDKNIIFKNKRSLLKDIGPGSFINEANCEELFVMYADDELTNEEKDLVEQFVYNHPQYQQEFELINKVRLEPETSIVFPAKEKLYRKEKDDKVVPFYWWRAAAAAIVLLFIGGFGWYISNKNRTATEPVDNTIVKSIPESKQTGPKKDLPVKTPENIVQNRNDKAKNAQRANNILSARKLPSENSTAKDANAKKGNKKQVNNIPESNIPVPGSVLLQDVAKIEKAKTDKINPGKNEVVAALENKTPIVDEAVDIGEMTNSDSDNDVIYFANTSVSKKNKLRGVFRKASRIFDKATNFDPTGRGIRIANIEIALK